MLTACTLPAQAQQNLAGHSFHNPNIMADVIEEATKDVDAKMAEARRNTIAKAEDKKGRSLNEKEIQEIDEQMIKAQQMITALRNGIKTAITVDFKTDKDILIKIRTSVSDDALKTAGVTWIKRKTLKAAMALAPKSQKGTYNVHGDIIIMDDGQEKDTLRISHDGKILYGTLDKKTKFRLTRTR